MEEGLPRTSENRFLVSLSQKAYVCRPDGRFLALLRTETAPTRPLKWDLPGGRFEDGEGPAASVLREIEEETGLSVRDIRPIGIAGEHHDDGSHSITIAYRAEADSTDVMLSYEHAEYRWVTKEEFLTLDSSDKWQEITRTYFS